MPRGISKNEKEVQKRPDPSNRAKRPRRSSANQAGVGPMSLVGDLDHENYVYRWANDEGKPYRRVEELRLRDRY